MRVGRAPDVDEPLERLLASLADSRRRIALLQDEVALYRSHTALMREALVIARSTIRSMQEKKDRRFVYNTLKRVGPIAGINLGKWKTRRLLIKVQGMFLTRL